MSRAYTKEEIKEKFLRQVQTIIWFWSNPEHSDCGNTFDRCEGVAFSILALIDGCDLNLPSFKLSPSPCPEDKEYFIEMKENWFPEDVDIAGSLHDQLKKYRRK